MIRSIRLLVTTIVVLSGLALGGLRPAAAQSGPDPTVTILANRHAIPNGKPVTFTITATNIGTAPATNVTVSAWGPDWFKLVSSTCSSGSGSDSCTVSTLNPGEQLVLTVVMTGLQACGHGDWHVFESAGVSADTDVNLDNNEASVNIQNVGTPEKC